MSNQNTPLVPSRPQRQTGRRAALIGGLTLAGAAALSLGAGAYDVGVTAPHSKPTEWALRHGMELSVRNQARDVKIPSGVDLRDRALAERAIGHYSVACAQCHGAPGHPAAPWMVLYPAPADLTEAETVSRWTDAELFWIIENGIKDTGMIALGPTHQAQDIWAVTAFVRQLPAMDPGHYHELVTRYQAQRAQMAPTSAHSH
ncbi:MAG TPA: cytochrome c [Polyangiaceae bacterium]|nr:cytochrome c [Polyangiaceae bacterium]